MLRLWSSARTRGRLGRRPPTRCRWAERTRPLGHCNPFWGGAGRPAPPDNARLRKPQAWQTPLATAALWGAKVAVRLCVGAGRFVFGHAARTRKDASPAVLPRPPRLVGFRLGSSRHRPIAQLEREGQFEWKGACRQGGVVHREPRKGCRQGRTVHGQWLGGCLSRGSGVVAFTPNMATNSTGTNHRRSKPACAHRSAKRVSLDMLKEP
jgi:hypothetical protein